MIELGDKLFYGFSSVGFMRNVQKAYTERKIKDLESVNIEIKNFHPLFANSQTISKLTDFDIKQIQGLNVSNFSQPETYKIRAELNKKLGVSDRFYFDRKKYHMPLDWDPSIDGRDFYAALLRIRLEIPWMYEMFQVLVKDVWLSWRDNESRFIGGTGTDYYFLGLMFMSLKPNTKFALLDQVFAISHELGHTVLYYLQAGKNPIEEESFSKWIYSGIRRTSRPSYASLHAAAALGYMVIASETLANSDSLSEEERVYVQSQNKIFRQDLVLGLEALNDIKLTDLGKVLSNELSLLVGGGQ